MVEILNVSNLSTAFQSDYGSKQALKNKTTLKAEALKSGLINEREYNKIVDPSKMIKPD